MAIKLNIGDPKSKRTVQIEIDDQSSHSLFGKKIGETFKGEVVDRPGYEFLITGGSDNAGFPMRNDVEGEGRKKILIPLSVGNKNRRKGIRLRKTVCGNTTSKITAQLNVKVVKGGKKPLVEPPIKEPVKEESAEKSDKDAEKVEKTVEKAEKTPETDSKKSDSAKNSEKSDKE